MTNIVVSAAIIALDFPVWSTAKVAILGIEMLGTTTVTW
jgi:hypothetical protein